MANVSITFSAPHLEDEGVRHPGHIVDFSRYAHRADDTSLPKIRTVFAASLCFLQTMVAAMGKAAYLTLRHSGTAFKQIVLNYYGRWNFNAVSKDLHFIVFKVVFWVVALGWCFLATTVRLLYPPKQLSIIAQIAGDEIDIGHIVASDSKIDMSSVPDTIVVADLLNMFDTINFTNPEHPGFMAPSSRTEDRTTYGVAKLRNSLQQFVQNVTQRVAFIGTPPSYDTPRLMAFYQQLEDAVRVSIHKTKIAVSDFQQEHGENPATYSESVQRQYKDLLENYARVPLMLAIAGLHCGARYMGEAMELYSACSGDNIAIQGSLRDALVVALAEKRGEIARAQIEQHLGNDTHVYANYMASYGVILGIPGTAHVIEHLSGTLDHSRLLPSFFQQYTVDCIIATIQDAMKRSQALREKLADWLKTQVGDWEPAGIEPLQNVADRANAILASDALEENFQPLQNLRVLQRLLNQLIEARPEANAHDDRDFWDQLNGLKQWFLTCNYPIVVSRREVEQNINALMEADFLGPQLLSQMRRAIETRQALNMEEVFRPRLVILQKVSRLCRETGLQRDTAFRVVEGSKDLTQALEEQRLFNREQEFLTLFSLEDIAQNGLTPQLCEWVLVAQGILLAQGNES